MFLLLLLYRFDWLLYCFYCYCCTDLTAYLWVAHKEKGANSSIQYNVQYRYMIVQIQVYNVQ